eukprot:CAMPEP_0119337928 /NCGR_PEP_ID=MMETSP1333-20130426/95033_1 /TAXON_ID=418940 /ORGANISM="Scyphosphaera apsteinii, Strain RCC1455" /LENGTH=396 /DNA_ID=CAMNT_0007349091 /DNA_START=50 /DNA_END=1240 /DNA_ORIENTATION=+
MNQPRTIGACDLMLKRLCDTLRRIRKITTVAKVKTPPVIEYAPLLGLDTHVDLSCSAVQPGERIIWSYWNAGRAAMPGFCQLCVESWERCNPGWRIVILDDANLKAFVAADELPTTFLSLMGQHRSDIVRAAVLVRFGGLYMDATTLCLQRLDGIWDDPACPDLLLTAPGSEDAPWSASLRPWFRWANNALICARRPGNPLLKAWQAAMLQLVSGVKPFPKTIEELEAHPLFADYAERRILRDPGFGILAKSHPYLSFVHLLTSLIYFEESLKVHVAESVRILPTSSWSFNIYSAIFFDNQCTLSWQPKEMLAKLWPMSIFRFVDYGEADAAARIQRAAVIKYTSSILPELEYPPDYFKKGAGTMGRIFRAATDACLELTPMATLVGMRAFKQPTV